MCAHQQKIPLHQPFDSGALGDGVRAGIVPLTGTCWRTGEGGPASPFSSPLANQWGGLCVPIFGERTELSPPARPSRSSILLLGDTAEFHPHGEAHHHCAFFGGPPRTGARARRGEQT